MTKLLSTNPADNYSKVGEIVISSAAEIADKVAKANNAKLPWKELGVKGRIKLLEPIRDDFKKRSEETTKLLKISEI